jgi:D-3-phosphoglycerate dehydrogenase
MDKKGIIFFLDTAHPLLEMGLQEAGYQCIQAYHTPYEQLLLQLGEVEGLIVRSRIPVDARLMDAAPRLRFIGRLGSGMENIDADYAKQKHIHCLNAPEGNRDAVGEHALGLLLSIMNHLKQGDREVRDGLWRREANRGSEIKGKTISIIGYGNTGSAFAQRLRGFEARVLAYDKYKSGFSDAFVQEAQMDQVFEESDILSLHVPLTDETHYLVNRDYLARFRKPLWLLNTSRGPVVQTRALLEALDAGKLQAAGLDVLEFEKKSLEGLDASAYPEDFKSLIQSEKVLLSPHVAGWTYESLEKLASVLLQKILALPPREA